MSTTTGTTINFVQPSNAPFQFIATLDGQQYTCTVTWNVFGQRYYLNIFTLDGTRILTIALVALINLVKGYFVTSTLVWSSVNQTFTIMP